MMHSVGKYNGKACPVMTSVEWEVCHGNKASEGTYRASYAFADLRVCPGKRLEIEPQLPPAAASLLLVIYNHF